MFDQGAYSPPAAAGPLARVVVVTVATVVHLTLALLLWPTVGLPGATLAGTIAGLAVGARSLHTRYRHGPSPLPATVVRARSSAPSTSVPVAGPGPMRRLERFGLGGAVVVAVAVWMAVALGMMAAEPTGSSLLIAGVSALGHWIALGAASRSDGLVALDRLAAEIGLYGAAAGIGILGLLLIAPTMSLSWFEDVSRLPQGDRGAGYAGMRYFLADEWRWPLLHTVGLRAPEGINIGFTDSIPIVALGAKALRPLLGPDVNYVPTWHLLVFTAQGPSAVLLLRQIGVGRPEILLTGAAVAVSMPSFIMRMGHPALTGHFLLLLAMAGAFMLARPDRRRYGFALIGAAIVAAVLVHPYLFLMSAPTVAGISLDQCRAGLVSFRRLVRHGTAIIGVTIAVMAACGYFGGSARQGSYGSYAMNVLSPVWPQYSLLTPGGEEVLAPEAGGWEGFNWLGVGTLLVVAVAVCAVVRGRRVGVVVDRWAATLATAGLLTAIAASHRVGVGPLGIYDGAAVARAVRIGADGLLLAALMAAVGGGLALWRWHPRWLAPFAVLATPVVMAALIVAAGPDRMTTMQASGRLWWPVGFLLALGAVAALDRLPRRPAAVIAVAAVALQLVDVQPVREAAAESMRQPLAVPADGLIAATVAEASAVRVLPQFPCARAATPEAAGIIRYTVTDVVTLAARTTTPVNTAQAARPPLDTDCTPSDTWKATGALHEPLAPGEVLVAVPPLPPDLTTVTAENHCRSDGRFLLCFDGWDTDPADDPGAFLPFSPTP